MKCVYQIYIYSIYIYKEDLALSSQQSNNNGGAHGVMVIVVGNGHGNTSSNPGRD